MKPVPIGSGHKKFSAPLSISIVAAPSGAVESGIWLHPCRRCKSCYELLIQQFFSSQASVFHQVWCHCLLFWYHSPFHCCCPLWRTLFLWGGFFLFLCSLCL